MDMDSSASSAAAEEETADDCSIVGGVGGGSGGDKEAEPAAAVDAGGLDLNLFDNGRGEVALAAVNVEERAPAAADDAPTALLIGIPPPTPTPPPLLPRCAV